METSHAHKLASPGDLHQGVQLGPARQCVVVDRHGKRMVLPRYSEADAIEQIAIAMAGRSATSEEKRIAWERLRDREGYAVRWLQPNAASGPNRSGRRTD